MIRHVGAVRGCESAGERGGAAAAAAVDVGAARLQPSAGGAAADGRGARAAAAATSAAAAAAAAAAGGCLRTRGESAPRCPTPSPRPRCSAARGDVVLAHSGLAHRAAAPAWKLVARARRGVASGLKHVAHDDEAEPRAEPASMDSLRRLVACRLLQCPRRIKCLVRSTPRHTSMKPR